MTRRRYSEGTSRANMPGEGDNLSTWLHRRDRGSPYSDAAGASPGSEETKSLMDSYGSPYHLEGGGATPRVRGKDSR